MNRSSCLLLLLVASQVAAGVGKAAAKHHTKTVPSKVKHDYTTVQPKVKHEVCQTMHKADIVFIIDSSNSISDTNYKNILQFIVDITNSFQIKYDGVRVGVIISGRKAHYDIPLGQHHDLKSLNAALKHIKHYKGITFTHKALKVLRTKALNETNHDGVSRQAVVIKDGKSQKTSLTVAEAKKCQDAGIVMTAVGINEAPKKELKDIAGNSSQEFYVKSFNELPKIVPDVKEVVCKASITSAGLTTSSKTFDWLPISLGITGGVVILLSIVLALVCGCCGCCSCCRGCVTRCPKEDEEKTPIAK